VFNYQGENKATCARRYEKGEKKPVLVGGRGNGRGDRFGGEEAPKKCEGGREKGGKTNGEGGRKTTQRGAMGGGRGKKEGARTHAAKFGQSDVKKGNGFMPSQYPGVQSRRNLPGEKRCLGTGEN